MTKVAIPVIALLLPTTLPAQQGADPEGIWSYLRTQYDEDGDGKVTAAEYPRGERQFRNLDRNDDGFLSAADFPRRQRGDRNREGRRDRGSERTRRPPRVPDEQLANRLGDTYGSFLDVDGEPGLSKADWDALLSRLDPDEAGVIADAEIRAITGPAGQGRMARMTRGLKAMLDRDGDGTVTTSDLETAFATLDSDGDGLVELDAEIQLPPGVGQTAPDFTLPMVEDPDEEVTLSSFRQAKPVALVFGSYT